MSLHKKHLPYTAESGHFICYLNRTYHVLPTAMKKIVDRFLAINLNCRRFIVHARVSPDLTLILQSFITRRKGNFL